MLTRKFKIMFASTMFASAAILASNWEKINENYETDNLYKKIILKEKSVLALMQSKYGFQFDVPIILTKQLEDNVYGVTICDKDDSIKIYLNKKIVQNNLDYVLDTVIPHEYAHALMFKQKLLAKNRDGYALRVRQVGLTHKSKHDGHNHIWQKTCKDLGGDQCQKFVTHKDAKMSQLF